ncbi:L-fucose dehydrogenase isoform X1 [Manis javanica]|uniref:L-fucose dehydrogenase isoform X1 n=1 Tax=Manis javanica TaxID=9974 RepID=UPI001879AFE5|nr:17-beta-hydroxysteroid dehydrogenase 14 isoform X1 [Manis javanica]XP_017521119.2 17-beta-hydroxysteroid dehydrogenase 14 isoform X1 [Manis javanica]XP_017521120.2 17-beta-hydroxysteroid dehydrogenase 14 isoform X1 [Manis javanica]XP_017521121.2 17-beta-hydroxysteroid dehydrogenase 14 isoform X1 [Manis javanica]
MATGTRYAGKVVVVTGGGRGIGAGIVRAFERGTPAPIPLLPQPQEPRPPALLPQTRSPGSPTSPAESGGRALEQELPGAVFLLCDVTREEDVRTLISETVHRFGRLDCVVNNAGYHPPPQWPEETSAQGFRQLLELNLLGMYTLTKLALPHLRKSRGNIINISSLVGAIGQLQAVPYVATKGAVTAMTKALALDESQYGVRVNCISPGNIWTPLWEELAALTPDPAATVREGALAQPLGRMGQPSDVGAAAVFLASEANFCTGIELFVTGGAELGYGCKACQGAPTSPS